MKHIHILGICGTAMAAIAKLAKDLGYSVTGSDQGIYPPMSDFLVSEGISIAAFSVDNLNPQPDFVVIGNAMSRGNIEVEMTLDLAIPYLSGPEFIGKYVLPRRHAVVVAGTHGKTTTSSILAHILESAGLSPGFMIGGIPEDFGAGARLGEGESFVLEGDEYDTAFFDKRSKFLHYQSRTLILNNLEFDHADIFPNLDAIKTQFHHLIRTVPKSGNIIVNADDVELEDVLRQGCWTPLTRFAKHGGIDAQWQWKSLKQDGSAFELYQHGKRVIQVQWDMIGIHNISNACAVAAAATSMGVSVESIQAALQSFSGIRRRMTLVGEAKNIRIFDDFAHHPTAITGMVSAAKAAMKTEGKLWVIIEPRSNTMRTRIHQERLPACFIDADEVIFIPASDRNLDQDDVLDTELVCEQIGTHARVLADVDAIIKHVSFEAQAGDDVLILSNGGFEGIHQKLLLALKRK